MNEERLVEAKWTFIPQLKVTPRKSQYLSIPQPNVPQLSVFTIGEKTEILRFFS